jgi:hypothetical protein
MAHLRVETNKRAEARQARRQVMRAVTAAPPASLYAYLPLLTDVLRARPAIFGMISCS